VLRVLPDCLHLVSAVDLRYTELAESSNEKHPFHQLCRLIFTGHLNLGLHAFAGSVAVRTPPPMELPLTLSSSAQQKEVFR